MQLKNPFLFQEFTKKPKQASKQTNKKTNKNRWNHLSLSVENNNRYIRFQDK